MGTVLLLLCRFDSQEYLLQVLSAFPRMEPALLDNEVMSTPDDHTDHLRIPLFLPN